MNQNETWISSYNASNSFATFTTTALTYRAPISTSTNGAFASSNIFNNTNYMNTSATVAVSLPVIFGFFYTSGVTIQQMYTIAIPHGTLSGCNVANSFEIYGSYNQAGSFDLSSAVILFTETNYNLHYSDRNIYSEPLPLGFTFKILIHVFSV